MRTFDIVVTTIFEPVWLAGYLENLRHHGHEQAVTIRIIGDRKTPRSVYIAAADAAAQGFRVDCPDLDEQEAYLRRLGLPEGFIPWNTDNRRNIGYLRAWESGADVLVSIDDDNLCRADSDFIGCHDVVGSSCGELAGDRCASGAPWFNLCEQLTGETAATIYPRGYPYRARKGTGEPEAQRPPAVDALPAALADRRVAVNAGLWIDDPDVDAITRLALRPRIKSADTTGIVLAPGTWSPINTQNTALLREALPAYYYVRMGAPLKGMTVDRFGDIWSGYFLQRCAEQVGDVARVGAPVADHRRQAHDLFRDLYAELGGIVLTEELLPWLRDVGLTASSYLEAYEELAEALAAAADTFSGFLWDDGGREFLRSTATHMATWTKAIRTLSCA